LLRWTLSSLNGPWFPDPVVSYVRYYGSSSMATEEIVYEPHVGQSRQYWRDIVLGVNDGLVSMFLLIAGVVGGGLSSKQVLLTGLAGALAGAISMGAGEYLATKSQDQVLESELNLERTHIQYFRDQEVDQLYDMFRDLGITEEDLPQVVEAFSRTDQALLNAMKVLEFGVVDSERRSPIRAMITSAVLFLVGSSPSVTPFFFSLPPSVALTWAAALAAIGLFAVGVGKTYVTRENPWRGGLENLAIAGIGGTGAFFLGRLVGGSL
jgi:vacuolar iron transporter family protein